MAHKTVYLKTIGCQMNMLDSELVLAMLRRSGYEPTDQPDQADLILINTCSVRRHAEEKAFAHLGAFKHLKQRRGGMIIGVIGCMAQWCPEQIVQRCPHVDLLCAPSELYRLPELLADLQRRPQRRALALSDKQSRRRRPHEPPAPTDPLEALDAFQGLSDRPCPAQAFVRIQRGCDKFCSFCVVPFTRGPEQSRPPAHIVEEVKRLAEKGVRQVTLLGQTVNSYRYRENGRQVTLAELLARVHEVDGIERIRFITSYPGDFADAILDAMRELPKVCEYLHLPAQSGSDEILRRMRRRYTAAGYLELVARAKERVPGIALAGDFIVGFPGETEADFAKTVEMVQRVEYKNIFCFKYSPRPGTTAAKSLPDDVPDEVKRRRNQELLRVQHEIASRNNQQCVGRIVEVLVEGYSKAAIKARKQAGPLTGDGPARPSRWPGPDQLVGRTRGDQIVVFQGGGDLIGQLVAVRITSATALTLHGELTETPTGSSRSLQPATQP